MDEFDYGPFPPGVDAVLVRQLLLFTSLNANINTKWCSLEVQEALVAIFSCFLPQTLAKREQKARYFLTTQKPSQQQNWEISITHLVALFSNRRLLFQPVRSAWNKGKDMKIFASFLLCVLINLDLTSGRPQPPLHTKEADRLIESSDEEAPSPDGANPECRMAGSVKYAVEIKNMITKSRFPFIPEGGLAFANLVGASHSQRFSVLVFRGYASAEVQILAERSTSNNLVRLLQSSTEVKSVSSTELSINGGMSYRLTVEIDCQHPTMTFVASISPSPDFLIALPNFSLLQDGDFISHAGGFLKAYDAGTDKGPLDKTSVFTPPDEEDLDIPAVTPFNIHPLSESPLDPGFRGENVGEYYIRRI